MSSLESIRITALALAALCVGTTLPGSASALSIHCTATGCVVTVDPLDLEEAAEAASFRSIPSSALLGSLLTSRGCSVSDGSISCVDPASTPTRGRVSIGPIQLGSSRFLDALRSGTRYTVPNRPHDPIQIERGRANPIPEPSAALIFGAGILVASGLVKRTGSIE